MSDISEAKPLMPAELAKLMGCSRPLIDAALKDGTIPHTRLGRRIFIPRSVADALLSASPLRRAG
jgi:excisionase family DNA binding protein